jgi:hypothetical protein
LVDAIGTYCYLVFLSEKSCHGDSVAAYIIKLCCSELANMIVPLLDGGENRTISKSYVIKNKKLLANAVSVFEKRSLPLCSRRYQKISNTTCNSNLCNAFRHGDINPYAYQSIEQELRDFCLEGFQNGRTS